VVNGVFLINKLILSFLIINVGKVFLGNEHFIMKIYFVVDDLEQAAQEKEFIESIFRAANQEVCVVVGAAADSINLDHDTKPVIVYMPTLSKASPNGSLDYETVKKRIETLNAKLARSLKNNFFLLLPENKLSQEMVEVLKLYRDMRSQIGKPNPETFLSLIQSIAEVRHSSQVAVNDEKFLLGGPNTRLSDVLDWPDEYIGRQVDFCGVAITFRKSLSLLAEKNDKAINIRGVAAYLIGMTLLAEDKKTPSEALDIVKGLRGDGAAQMTLAMQSARVSASASINSLAKIIGKNRNAFYRPMRDGAGAFMLYDHAQL